MGRASGSLLTDILKVAFIFLIALFLLAVAAFISLRVFIRGTEVEVPNVIGRSFIDASKILSEHGLNTVKIEGEKYSAQLPEGYVIKQDPGPAKRVKSERTIKLFLSKGTELGRVPRLIGHPVSDVEPKLASAGLEMGSVIKVHSDDYPQEGFVIAHTPPSDATVQWGSKVNLLVSLGPHSVTMMMPDLRDMDLQEALKVLEKRGLKQGNITYETPSGRKKANIILDQSPQPEDRVEKGAAVDLVVSKAAAEDWRTVTLSYTVPPRPVQPPENPEEDEPVEEDRSPRRVKIEMTHEGAQEPIEVINKFYAPDEIVSGFWSVKGIAITKIFVDGTLAQTMISKPTSTVFTAQ